MSSPREAEQDKLVSIGKVPCQRRNTAQRGERPQIGTEEQLFAWQFPRSFWVVRGSEDDKQGVAILSGLAKGAVGTAEAKDIVKNLRPARIPERGA